MEFIIIVAIVVCLFLWKKLRKVELDAQKRENEYQNIVTNQKEEIHKVVERNNILNSRVVSCKKENEHLRRTINELKRELDFYKNIDEDSANLNSFDDSKTREVILEQISQEIRNRKTEIDPFSNTSLQQIHAVLDQEQVAAYEEMEHGRSNLFITGKAGTGKSFLLDVFRRTTGKNHIVLAPTGIAALNVKGATLHSTFGYYNLVKLDVDAISKETIRLKSEKKLILREVSTIIIDEISMVRADTLDKIDRILKAINRSELPFGGKQMLLFGDLFQLPPVTKAQEYEYLLDRYGGVHFFSADAYKQGDFGFIELTINHRQKEDAEYFELLNRIRDGSVTREDIEILNTRVAQDPSIYERFTTLLPTKAEVETLNQYHIDQLGSEEFTYIAKVVLDKYPNNNHNLENMFPILSTLHLKKGALVMMVANDSEHRWVNGTLGIVKKLSKDGISVAINRRTYEIRPMEFSEQEITYENKTIAYEDVLKVVQYPIVPAYAITIHKSQGQTYQNIVCDIDKCFANGQAYVALSRCASLAGLHLKKKISGASIHVDKSVLSFYEKEISKNTR